MKNKGLLYSLGLHSVLVLLILVGLPNIFSRNQELLTPVAIQVVATEKPEEKKTQPPKTKPAAVPKPNRPPPAPSQPQVKPTLKPAVQTPQKPPEAKPNVLTQPTLKPKEKPQLKPEPEPKVEDKPQAEPDIASVLTNLKKEVELTAAHDSNLAPESELAQDLSQDELAALRHQLKACWNMPAGLENAHTLVVDVKILINSDRTVRKAIVLEERRMASDPLFRAAAESALHALQNPHCSPLMLPQDKYNMWKETTFSFNPKDML